MKKYSDYKLSDFEKKAGKEADVDFVDSWCEHRRKLVGITANPEHECTEGELCFEGCEIRETYF